MPLARVSLSLTHVWCTAPRPPVCTLPLPFRISTQQRSPLCLLEASQVPNSFTHPFAFFGTLSPLVRPLPLSLVVELSLCWIIFDQCSYDDRCNLRELTCRCVSPVTLELALAHTFFGICIYIREMNRVRLFCALLALVFCMSHHATEAIDYHVAAVLPLSGSLSPGPAVTNQWMDLLQYTASSITSAWNNGNRLLVTSYDSQSSRFHSLQLANNIATNTTMMAAVAIGLPDAIVEEMSLVLKFSEVRSCPSQ